MWYQSSDTDRSHPAEPWALGTIAQEGLAFEQENIAKEMTDEKTYENKTAGDMKEKKKHEKSEKNESSCENDEFENSADLDLDETPQTVDAQDD